MIHVVLAAALLAQESAPPPVCPPAPPRVCVCQGPAAPPPREVAAAERSRWYGGPAVAIDVASLALMAGGVATENVSTLLAGGAAYTLGAPIVHLASQHPMRVLASLGIRALGGGLATGAVMLDVLGHPCGQAGRGCRRRTPRRVALARRTPLTV